MLTAVSDSVRQSVAINARRQAETTHSSINVHGRQSSFSSVETDNIITYLTPDQSVTHFTTIYELSTNCNPLKPTQYQYQYQLTEAFWSMLCYKLNAKYI